MTREEIKRSVLGALRQIAPEVDVERLAPDVPLRDQIDLDSMDVLNFTLDACVDYLASALPAER